MTQMLDMIKSIGELNNSTYMPERDNPKILKLYQTIYEMVNDKNNYVANSAAMMHSLSEHNLSEEERRQWLDYAGGIFASYLAVKLYEERENEQYHFSCKELDQVLDFFLAGNSSSEVTSLGIYACAQQLITEDPMRCYELTKTAFTIHSDLAGLLGVTYRYEGAAAEEHITDECPFCGSGGEEMIPYYCSPQVLKLNNNPVFPPAKLWMKCGRCGNYFTYNFPKENIGTINGHYTNEKSNIILENKFSLSLYNQIFQQFKSLTSGKEYLEIGVGTGEMLAVALEFGYHVDAVEICREDCERISSVLDVNIRWCDMNEYETDKRYDVIVMGDVLEHVLHPVEVLNKVKHMLADDGVLWISTPNYNCAYARMQRFAHCMWHELNHYTYVSYETLAELMKKMQLEIVRYDISTRYIGSMELFVQHVKR